MNKNNLDERMLYFFEPIFKGEDKKSTPASICFMNGAISLIVLSKDMNPFGICYVVVAVILALLSFKIILRSESYMVKAIYGFFETLALLSLSYYASYTEYMAAGYKVKPYFIYTQMIGAAIFVAFLLILLYRLKGTPKEITGEQIEKGIKIGLWICIVMLIVIVVGLIVLYFTVFQEEMHLVKSSKMLYVAMVLNILVAYYALKSFYTIKYRKVIRKEIMKQHKKKRR